MCFKLGFFDFVVFCCSLRLRVCLIAAFGGFGFCGFAFVLLILVVAWFGYYLLCLCFGFLWWYGWWVWFACLMFGLGFGELGGCCWYCVWLRDYCWIKCC